MLIRISAGIGVSLLFIYMIDCIDCKITIFFLMLVCLLFGEKVHTVSMMQHCPTPSPVLIIGKFFIQYASCFLFFSPLQMENCTESTL